MTEKTTNEQNIFGGERPPLNSSSSSSSFPSLWKIELEGLREEEIEQTGESLSAGLFRIFGKAWEDTIDVDIDRIILKKNYKLVNLIQMTKVYSPRGFLTLYEEALGFSSKTLYRVQKLLTKYELLNITKWVGQARSTFGITLYFTHDATQYNFEKYLIDYTIQDELRYEKQLQRDSKKSPKEVVDYNAQVRDLSKKAKKEEPLSNQEKAKAIKTSKKISKHTYAYQKEAADLQHHIRQCSICKRAQEFDEENKCHMYNNLRQRYEYLGDEVLDAISKVPDRISEMAIDNSKVLEYTDEISKRIVSSNSIEQKLLTSGEDE